MYVICSEVRFVEISPPNECDKILKIPNKQTEPTDYMANCSTDVSVQLYIPIRFAIEASGLVISGVASMEQTGQLLHPNFQRVTSTIFPDPLSFLKVVCRGKGAN